MTTLQNKRGRGGGGVEHFFAPVPHPSGSSNEHGVDALEQEGNKCSSS